MIDQPPRAALGPMDIQAIMARIPHRYPLLLVDRVQDLELSQRAVGVKAVTMGEPFFQGHFPGHPVMPGVLIVESMAQTAAALVSAGESKKVMEDQVVYFMSIEQARFRRPVTPGCVMFLHVERIHSRGAVWKFKGVAKVDGRIMAEAAFTAMVRKAA